ncbi:MAG: PQQ-binding-like beta-propeller repeat protein [Pseudomonadota bacterium]
MTFLFSLARGSRIAALLLAAMLAGCGSNPITNLFDGDDDEEEGDEAPAEDDRISILALEEQIQADPRYANVIVDVPPSYVNVSWPQPGGEADHTLHHIAATLTLEKKWKVDVGAAGERAKLTSPPIVVADRVFVIDAETRLTAFDAETGEVLWRRELAPEIKERFRIRELFRGPTPAEIGFGGGVAFDQGKVFVTSGFGFVAAIDAISGEEIWRVETNAPIRTPPTAYRGRVYLTTNVNEFLALDQETGEKTWTFQSFEEAARFLSSASPAAAGDLVVAPFSSGEVVAFLTESGRAVWNETLAQTARLTALATLNDIAGSPVIDRGLIYVSSHGGSFAAIDIRSGQRVWETAITSLQTPWVAGDFIFLVSVDGELICVSRNDGAIVWVSELRRYKNEKKKKGRVTWAGPVLAGGNLILVSNLGELAKVDPTTGEIREMADIDEPSVISPVVADETVFILSEKGRLLALR